MRQEGEIRERDGEGRKEENDRQESVKKEKKDRYWGKGEREEVEG